MQPNPSQPAVGKKSSGSDSPRSFYAHSNGVLPEKWHLLEDHLQSVAKLSAEFAQSFDSSDWAWNAGWLHDLGKAADEFQAYLMRENGLDDEGYDLSGRGRVNHSSAGAAFAEERFNLAQCPIGRVLAYIIAGHHAGLPDWFSSDTAGAAWSARLEEGQTNLNRIRPIIGDFVADLKAVEKPPSFVNQDNFHLWVRMLFSCLVDSDFLDTEAFMNPDQARLRGGFVPMADLKSVFDKSMADLSGRTSAEIGSVNLIRQEILERCRFAAKDAPGLFSLTVPTGGGKTLSSMAFALEHALRHKKSRIIYVIPYTSIIEQTAGVFASIFGRDNVVEHHSNLDPERETQRTRFASENWDAPIIVTTNVQFFESLFAARPSRCRKIHNLINSVVVLDEAQLLPPGKLTPCVDVINQLSRHYGVSFIFSTATQPALPNLDGVREIIPNVSEL